MLILRLSKREDQALIPLSTILKFSAQSLELCTILISRCRPWISFPFSDLGYLFHFPTLDILSRFRPWISFPESGLGYPFQIQTLDILSRFRAMRVLSLNGARKLKFPGFYLAEFCIRHLKYPNFWILTKD